MDEAISADQRAKEEADIRARDDKRRREEEDRKRRQEAERAAEEKKVKDEKRRLVEEERKRKKQEEEWKKLGSDKILPLPPVPASSLDDNDAHGLKAWFLDDDTSKPALKVSSLKKGKKKDAPRVTLSQLKEIGVVYFRINLNDFSIVNQIVKERLYKHTDEIRVSQTCKDEQFLDRWFAEHMNEDEQVRLITDGSCFIDIRAKNDTWIRMQANAGDLIVFAPGLYHRGTLDQNDYCAIMRIFRDAQRWSPVFRTEKRADGNQSRLQYLKVMKKGSVGVDLGFK